MQEQSTKNNDNCKDPTHELWLIYCQLKQAETEPEAREQIISSARYQLGRVLNALNHFRFELKSPGNQAAKLNCRDRQKDLTPDSEFIFPPAIAFSKTQPRLSSVKTQELCALLPLKCKVIPIHFMP